MSRGRVPRKPRSFAQIVLQETVILVPAAIIFAVYQGGALQDWLVSLAAVVVIGLAFGLLMQQRQKIAQRPLPQRPPASSTVRRKKR